MYIKKLITAVFGSNEPLFMLRLMGVSASFLHRESTNSVIHVFT